MPQVLVLRTGEAVERVQAKCGSFPRLFERGLNARMLGRGNRDALDDTVRPPRPEFVRVEDFDVTVRRPGDALPSLECFAGVIVTGSPAYVGDDEPWMRWCAGFLQHLLARDIPLLAVCFGHQLLGQTLGCDVGPNARGREMGTIEVEVTADDDDPLFGPRAGAPFGAFPRRFLAQCSHRDVIRVPSDRLRVLGRAAHDDHHIVRAGPRAWGVQFHPEFSDDVMSLYLEARRDAVDRDLGAGSCDRRLAAVRPTPIAASVLVRFAELCRAEAHARGIASLDAVGGVHGS